MESDVAKVERTRKQYPLMPNYGYSAYPFVNVREKWWLHIGVEAPGRFHWDLNEAIPHDSMKGGI